MHCSRKTEPDGRRCSVAVCEAVLSWSVDAGHPHRDRASPAEPVGGAAGCRRAPEHVLLGWCGQHPETGGQEGLPARDNGQHQESLAVEVSTLQPARWTTLSRCLGLVKLREPGVSMMEQGGGKGRGRINFFFPASSPLDLFHSSQSS